MSRDLRPEDDSFHRGSDDPTWNESGYFGFSVPERDMSGWVYLYHRPNMGYTVGGVALWDPSGEETYDCRYYDFGFASPLAPDADMFDCTTANGLAVELLKPLSSYRFAYRGDGCEMDLEWHGARDPHATGLGLGSEDWGSAHYDAAGRMEGVIRTGDESIPVSCWSYHDHSWGPRGWVRNPRGSFPVAVADEDHAFALWTVCDLPPGDDPIVGTTERVIKGWYLRDGVSGTLVEGTRRCDRDDDGRPLRNVIDARDHLGRELHAEGTCRNALRWTGYPFLFMWWCLTSWEFDGLQAWGEDQDLFPLQQHRRFARSLRKRH